MHPPPCLSLRCSLLGCSVSAFRFSGEPNPSKNFPIVFVRTAGYNMSGRQRMRKRPFRVLVATDASPQAKAALAAVLAFPWPDGTQAQGVGRKSGVTGVV